ncbi:hypothetical protein TNCV_736921 [Trichonephila clavipes]|nr:hypothetical protein TNCV_736921 [Trichonephila clavipes]
MKEKAARALMELTQEDFQHCFEQRVIRMERCRDRKRDRARARKMCRRTPTEMRKRPEDTIPTELQEGEENPKIERYPDDGHCVLPLANLGWGSLTSPWVPPA